MTVTVKRNIHSLFNGIRDCSWVRRDLRGGLRDLHAQLTPSPAHQREERGKVSVEKVDSETIKHVIRNGGRDRDRDRSRSITTA